eukprot:Colp12_sorted_trinity150504_noHs@8570
MAQHWQRKPFASALLCLLFIGDALAIRRSQIEEDRWAGYTNLNLVKGTQVAQGSTFQRYHIEGSGPAWTTMNEVGTYVVSQANNSRVQIIWSNLITEDSLVHIHGQTPPLPMDGEPYISTHPIEPNRMTVYDFALQPHNIGTYWMHSHQGLQEEQGLLAPFIVQGDLPKGFPLASKIKTATEIIMTVEDFCGYATSVGPSQNPTCFNPYEVYDTLKAMWEEVQNDFDITECREPGVGGDVAYKYQLANGRTLDNPVLVTVTPGNSYRLRIINVAAMTNYKIQFPFTVTFIAVDGQYIKPFTGDSFWLAIAQRVDVFFTVPKPAPDFMPIFSISEGTTGSSIQSGIILVKEGVTQSPPSYPLVVPGPGDMGGSIGIQQEMKLQAWYPLATKPADRTFNVDLTGDNGFRGINGYSWQMPPLVPMHVPNPFPLTVKFGDRVCIRFKNFNPDAHPMHLHGHTFQVVEINGQPFEGAMRDTVLVPRGNCQTVKVCFNADNYGTWFLHCHMSYHLAAGMTTSIEYLAE